MNDRSPGLVAVPAVDWIYTRPAMSLQAVSHNLPPGSGWQWMPGNVKSVEAKRNEAAEAVMKHGLDWLCFLDSDMVFPENTVHRLLEVDADVAAGLYVTKTRESNYMAEAGHMSIPDGAPADRPTDHPDASAEYLDLRRLNGTTEVDVVGAGCMLIHRRVLEAVERPWFVASREVNPSFGEDYNFTLRAKRAGFSVKVDTTLRCRHVGANGVGVPEALGWQAVARQRERSSVAAPARTEDMT